MSFVVGIDLGTSNSALAIRESGGESSSTVPIRQVISASAQGDEQLLSSSLFIVPEGEGKNDNFVLPWAKQDASTIDSVVGRYARDRGTLLPDHFVSSAKSWLCNGRVDRKGKILPWGSNIGERKISPFDASRVFLEHLRNALTFSVEGAKEISSAVLTVPASFDEAARSLTVEAAKEAGFKEITLLEEPVAAIYAWLDSSAESWRDILRVGDVILVVDVGGGTTDFSLVSVVERDEEIDLQRISVGDHILLGGDNMDLALAHLTRHRLEERGVQIDEWQFMVLVHSIRGSKERLLADATRVSERVALPSRAAGLFDSVVSVDITRVEIEEAVSNGFFPKVSIDAEPHVAKAGLRDFGLSFASDAAVTKHLARFLRRSRENVVTSAELKSTLETAGIPLTDSWIRPTAILFNGGVFGAEVLQQRLVDQLEEWSGEKPRVLESTDLGLAVARGAAFYGQIRESGKGVRIRSGLSRSYYIGVESSGLAVPGVVQKMKGVCVAPQGLEAGDMVELKGQTFGLVVGESCEFSMFSSNVRAGDVVGTVLPDVTQGLSEVARLQTVADAPGTPAGTLLPVSLRTVVNELGVLEVWLQEDGGEKSWQLHFDVREGEAGL